LIRLCLSLVALAWMLSLLLTALVRTISRRLQTFDTLPVAGQIKAPTRRIPNTGGIAIFWAFVAPIAATIGAAWLAPDFVSKFIPSVAPYLEGIRTETNTALVMLLSIGALHALGIIDDRRPLGPFLKLIAMTVPAIATVTLTKTRLLTVLDPVGSIPVFSSIATVLWFLVVTNAMNFMDNMDGLSAGCAATAAAFFLFGCIVGEQWFVAACLALLLGSLLGFLIFNKPPATIFMGDGGSLVVGFLLAFLTVRTTYLPKDFVPESGRWFAVLTPLVVLAVPLYDFCSVTLIRISQGRSPFVGDLNHLSHRLVRRGMTRSAAVSSICGLTAVTGVSGLLLRHADRTEALLIGLQIVLLLIVVARVEFATAPKEIAQPENLR